MNLATISYIALFFVGWLLILKPETFWRSLHSMNPKPPEKPAGMDGFARIIGIVAVITSILGFVVENRLFLFQVFQ